MNKFRYLKNTSMGYDHRRVGTNCQDSAFFIHEEGFDVGFVVDGMGDPVDSPFSEVGSRIVASVAANYVADRLRKALVFRRKLLIASDKFWSEVQNHILDCIHQSALLMGGNYKKTIVSYFLHTITGFVSIPELTVFVGVGDGFFGVDGLVYKVTETAQENMPASLSYHLVESTLRTMSPDEITLRVIYQQPTNEISKFLIATDGLRFFLQDTPIDGVFELKPEFGVWDDQTFFDNEYAFGWKMNELSSEKRTINWEEERVVVKKPTALDDLALIVGSRI